MLKVVWLWIVTRTERSEAAARTSASPALSWALAALPCGTHARDHCRRRQKSVRLARGFFAISPARFRGKELENPVNNEMAPS